MIVRTPCTTSACAVRDLETAPAAKEARGTEPSLLPAPDYVATDPTAMIAKLLVKSSQQKRASDEVSASAAEAAEDAADAKRIEAMASKAEMTMIAGMTAGLGQVASGALSFGSGCAGAAQLKVDSTPATASQAAHNASAKWDGAAAGAGGGGKIAEAGLKSEADRFDRKIADAESGAKHAKRAQDQLRRQIDAGSQHEGKVMQLLQEISQAQTQCARASLLRMA